jgi:hypothetical protein
MHNGNRYILVVIYHYPKWVKAITKHDTRITTKFLKEEIIYRFRTLRYILINNGGEWVHEFDQLCKNYGITHQYITFQWPKYNDMVQILMKPLKHGLIVFIVTIEHAQDWDEHVPHILFGYKCVI